MESLLIIIGVTFGISLIIIIVARLTAKRRNENKQVEQGQEFVNRVQEMFENNISMTMRQIYSDLNISTIEDIFPKMSDNRAWFNSYSLAIAVRHDLKYCPIPSLDQTQFNLNLKSNEVLYIRIYSTSLYAEKVTRRDISYSGVRWNNEMLRAGSLSLITHEIKNFVFEDIGSLNITSERIIFIGKQKNIVKAINIDNIITYNLFQDGVLVLQPNKSAILFKFEKFEGPELLQDGLNQFVIVLSRILKNNQADNLNVSEINTGDNDNKSIMIEVDETSNDRFETIEEIQIKLDDIKNRLKKIHDNNDVIGEMIKRENNQE